MTRRRALAAVAALAAVTLAGCGTRNAEQATLDGTAHPYAETAVHLKDGRTVTCLSWAAGQAGGISCDWDNAR